MRKFAFCILISLFLIQPVLSSTWDNTDTLLFVNLLDLTQRDVFNTIDNVQKYGKDIELMPLTREVADKPDVYKGLSLISMGFLANRWHKEADPKKRKMEMLVCNLFEAGMLHGSGYDWVVQYGFAF